MLAQHTVGTDVFCSIFVMSAAGLSRAIKEEILTADYPEMYTAPASNGRRIKRVAPKTERKVKVEVKDEIKKEIKRKGRRRKGETVNYEDEVELVRTFAPRRPYQWKGRRVRKVLRPGVVVSFTPGQRTGRATKRSYDEVYGDEDILEQAAARSGEFAYGKRAKLQAVPLVVKNETPELKPITPQVAVPLTGKRRQGDLQPTVQVMVPAKRSRTGPGPVVIKDEDMSDVGPSGLFIPAIKPMPRIKSEIKMEPGVPMDVDKITLRPVKRVAHDMEVQTVDVEMKPRVKIEPKMERSSVGTMTETTADVGTNTARKGRPRRAYGVRYHPSIVMNAPPVKRTRRSRKSSSSSSRRIRRTVTSTRLSSGTVVPTVIYHPSIRP